MEDISKTDGVLDGKRAAHLYKLIKESGEDNCCVCGVSGSREEEEDGVNPFVSVCGHLFCSECRRGECPCGKKLGEDDVYQVEAEVEECEDEWYVEDVGASTKIKMLVRDLVYLKKGNEKDGMMPIKCIVFSQWTQFLDLIEGPLKTNGFSFARLDGSMNRPTRTAELKRFKDRPDVNVILISIKAGGVGLNLTHASRVYIMKPYWNPAVEQQAIDRVHRMGQTLEVQTIRFIVGGSIEERMVETQEKKKRLVSMTFKGEREVGDGKEERMRGMRELMFGKGGWRGEEEKKKKEGE